MCYIKSIAIAAMLVASIQAHASTASANGGHHGGGNNGAVGAAAGAFGGSSASTSANSAAPGASSSSAAAGQSGMGGSYGDWYLRTSPEDNYQPYPESEMKQFAKASWEPYEGD